MQYFVRDRVAKCCVVHGVGKRKRFLTKMPSEQVDTEGDQIFADIPEDLPTSITTKSIDPSFDLASVEVPGGDFGSEGFPALGSGAFDAIEALTTIPAGTRVPLTVSSPKPPPTRVSLTGSVET